MSGSCENGRVWGAHEIVDDGEVDLCGGYLRGLWSELHLVKNWIKDLHKWDEPLFQRCPRLVVFWQGSSSHSFGFLWYYWEWVG